MNVLEKQNLSGTKQVAAAIEAAIRSGEMAPGSRLDSVRNLAEHFEVGMTVIIRALDVLEKKQLISRQPRRGVYVSEPEADTPKRRLLVLTNVRDQDKEASGIYLAPHFERLCNLHNWVADTMAISFLYSASEEKLIEQLQEKHYDGCISLGTYYIGTEKSLAILRALKIPVVFASAQDGDSDITGFPSLFYQPGAAWELAIAFLASKGIKRLGAAGYRNLRTDYHSLRCSQGEHFRLMRKYGMSVPENPVCYFDYHNEEDAREVIARWLDKASRFDAVICQSDFGAAFIYEYCESHGISIPGDLAVMGFGRYAGWDLLSPSLSTVDFRYDRIAARAFELLESASEWFGKCVPTAAWEPEILPGASTELNM